METKYLVLTLAVLSIFLISCVEVDLNGKKQVDEENLPPDFVFEAEEPENETPEIVVEEPENEEEMSGGFDISKGVTDENGCYDSEGGIFNYKRGYIIDAKGNRYEDECAGSTTISDVYCGIVGYKDAQSATCKYGCVNGSCIEGEDSPLKCTDTDYKDYDIKGSVTHQGKTTYDYCTDGNTLMEQFCTLIEVSNEEEKYCKYGCSDGACQEGPAQEDDDCTDSDFGKEPEFTKGTVIDKKGTIEDECLNSNTVKEYKCGLIGYRDSTNIECDNGCVDGACVR